MQSHVGMVTQNPRKMCSMPTVLRLREGAATLGPISLGAAS
jgi:energy-coupling factor transporter ATP-binding protein EcfA2